MRGGSGPISNLLAFLEKAEITDVLSAVTIINESLMKNYGRSQLAQSFRDDVAKIFAEENVGYAVDEMCGVHFAVDKEFANNTHAAIARLGVPRYAAAKSAFEASMSALDTPDGKLAVRSAFEAVEIVFKLLSAGSPPRISKEAIRSELVPVIEKVRLSNPVALNAERRLLDALSDWVDACHFYRHGQKEEEIGQPPIDAAILMVSTGASYLRWLVALDEDLQSKRLG